jgi:hypothetical protein
MEMLTHKKSQAQLISIHKNEKHRRQRFFSRKSITFEILLPLQSWGAVRNRACFEVGYRMIYRLSAFQKIFRVEYYLESLPASVDDHFDELSRGRAKAEKQARTKIGRVINVSDDVSDNSLFNWPVQANGADGFKLALCLISRRLEGIDARIVHTQHDEIIIEARDDIEDQVQTIVKESMEESLNRIIPQVTFVVESRVTEAWG